MVLVHFKGDFKGKHYDSDIPTPYFEQNYVICKQFGGFISATLEERIKNGSMEIVGRIGEVSPPKVIMPITVETNKPRLCHDERFLNLWMRDNPFRLDTLRDIPPMVTDRGVLMVKCDEKSAYDNVFIKKQYRTYFGVQFGEWFLQYKTLPFGYKCSPYVYQTIGMVVTSYLRGLGITNTAIYF